MSFGIQFLDSATSGCKGAVAPITIQEPQITFNTALPGDVDATEIIGGASLDPAPYGGTFINKGCEELIATITYLSGSDCDSCTVDSLSEVDVVVTIPANSVFNIPDGFWTGISYVLANAAADAKLQMVTFQSFYTPDCPECIVAIP